MALLYLLVLALALGLMGFSPDTHHLGGSGFSDLDWDHADWNNHYWNAWDFRRVYLGQSSPFNTTSEFFPEGHQTFVQQADLLLKMMGGLLALVASPAQTFFLLGLFVLLGNALGGYLLVRMLTGRRLAGFVSGLILCFSAATAWAVNTGNLEIGTSLCLCLYLAFFHRVMGRRSQRRHIIWAVVFGVLAILFYFVSFYHIVLLSLLLLLFRVRTLGRGQVRAVGIMVLAIAVLLLPLLVAFRTGARQHALEFSPIGAQRSMEHMTEVPYKNRALPGDILPGQRSRKQEGSATVFVLWLLVGYALVFNRKGAAPWLAAGLLFYLLSLGPYIRPGGEDGGATVPLPFYAFFRWLPMYHYIRFPYRMASFISLGLGVAAGFAVAHISQTLRGRVRTVVSLTVVVLLLAELNFSWGMRILPRQPENPFYKELAQAPGIAAVVEFPLDFGIFDARHLYHQTLHGKPLLNGVVPRYLGAGAIPTFKLVQENPLLRTAYAMQTPYLKEVSKYIPLDLPDRLRAMTPGQLRESARRLKGKGFSYIILHHKMYWEPRHQMSLPPGNALEQLFLKVLGTPIYQDSELMAFSLKLPQADE